MGRLFFVQSSVMAEHENSIGASDDWHTPPEPFERFKGPDGRPLRFLDPCAPVDRTHYYVPADKIFTKADNGLAQSWDGWIVSMNPPFGGREGHLPWLKKFFKHANGIAICRAYTSSRWWHQYIIPNAETLLFPRGKTKFIRPNGEVGTAPGHGIAFVGMGEVANTALQQSGLGWFVDLRGTHRRQKIAEIDNARLAVEVAS
jgi:hypothetical protein